MTAPDRPSPEHGRRAFLAGALALTAAACSSPSPVRSSDTPGSSPTSSGGPDASSSSSTVAAFVANGPREHQQVALTFHTNGDRARAETLLETVESHHAAITAFVVGSWLEANPDFAARILRGGHELANHTYSHLTFPKLDPAEMTTEVTRCRDVLASLTASGGRWFRPSGTTNGTDDPGPVVRTIAAAAGYSTVLGFDVDPADYLDPGADAVAARTIEMMQPGSIISLHFGHQGTIDALAAILGAVAQRGLQAVTVSTLLRP